MCNEEAELKKSLKDAEAALDALALAQYPKLKPADVQALVVDDKWLHAVGSAIHGEMDRISQALTQRVKQLADRYGTPLPALAVEVDALSARVDAQLKKMGLSWA